MDGNQKRNIEIQTGKRSLNSVRNGIASVSLSVFLLLLSFLSRTLFIHRLSIEYLGLNGVFSNVLGILSLSELGIGSAMSYALYQPIKNNDENKIRALMRIYRKLYLCVGSFIIAAGIMITPLLPLMVRDMPEDMPGITWYYLLFLLSMALPYFFSYKRSLIICYQREYIISIITGASKLLTTVGQLFILLFTGSYLWYLTVALVSVLAENILVSRLAGKMFPFLKSGEQSEISTEEEATIRENIKAIFFHKIGGTLTFSTDNLIISKVLGLAQIGLYSNYTAVTGPINSIFIKLMYSSMPSVGNLMAENEKDHAEKVFFHVLFVNAWIYGFVCTCYMCLVQPFITLWLGNAFLLSDMVVVCLVACIYLTNMRLTVFVFKESAGIFVQDRFRPLIEGCVNVAVSVPLAVKYGIPGVLFGTLISVGCISFWWEAIVFFQHAFGKGIGGYMFRQLKYLVFNGGIIVLCCYLGNLIIVDNEWIRFFLKAVICLIVPNLLYIVVFHGTEDFAYVKNTLMNMRLF